MKERKNTPEVDEKTILENDPILQKMLADEHVESQGVDFSLFTRLLTYVRPHAGLGVLALSLALVEAFIMTAPPYLIGVTVDAISGNEPRGRVGVALYEGLTGLGVDSMGKLTAAFALITAAAWALRFAFGVLSATVMGTLGQKVVHDLRVSIYRHILGMDMGFFHTNPVGRLVNRTTNDVAALSQLFSDALAQGSRDLLFLGILLVVMFRLDPVLTALVSVSIPALILVAWLYRRLARPALRDASALTSRMNAWLAENIAGMRENQLYRLQERRRDEMETLTILHQRAQRRVVQSWGLLRPGMTMVGAFATAAVLFVGQERVLSGVLSVGLLLTFVQYTNRMWVPIRNLSEKLNLLQTALTSAERLADVLDEVSEMKDSPDADPALVIERGEVRFEEVSFAYPTRSELALSNLSFDARAGQMIALVGDTGAGKSTVVHLLGRFYDPQQGQIRIDGNPISRYPLSTLRSAIALVPQDVVIFARSLRENITLGRALPDEQILEVLRAVQATDLVDSFAEGLDHVMSEGGRTLSAGQRQLIAFARALLLNPPVLILDEATANIDSHTEAKIQQALEQLTQGRTSLVVAHRLSTIKDADRILMMQHGEIIESGTHDELLAQDGAYALLYRTHLRDQEDESAAE